MISCNRVFNFVDAVVTSLDDRFAVSLYETAEGDLLNAAPTIEVVAGVIFKVSEVELEDEYKEVALAYLYPRNNA